MCCQWVGLSALRVLNTSRPLKVVQPLWIWGSNWGRPGRGKGGRAQPSSVKYTVAPTPGCTGHLPELWRVNTALTRTLRHDLTFHCWFLHKVAQPWSAVYLVSKYDSIHYFPVSQGNSQPWCALDVTANSWLTVEPSGQILKKHSMWLNEKHAWGASLSDKCGRSPGRRALTTFLFWGTHFKLAPWCRALSCFRGSRTLMLCEPHPLGKGRENCILRSCCHEDKYITIICCFLQLRKDLTFIFLWFWKKWCFCRPAKTHRLYCNSSGWAECSETPRSIGRIP